MIPHYAAKYESIMEGSQQLSLITTTGCNFYLRLNMSVSDEFLDRLLDNPQNFQRYGPPRFPKTKSFFVVGMKDGLLLHPA